MRSEVFRLLERDEAAKIVRDLERSSFVDGRVTAQGAAADVKRNLQVERAGTAVTSRDQMVVAALGRNKEFQAYVIPTRMVAPIFSRYEPGMKYGDHVDSALMGAMSNVRTDFAITIFLSPPSSYDGGELVIEGEEEVKLDAGEAYVYSATSIHHVAPVTRGVRLAAVIWVQSCVRDETMRGILWDLSRSIWQAEELHDRPHSLLLLKTYHNLLRYAAEPR